MAVVFRPVISLALCSFLWYCSSILRSTPRSHGMTPTTNLLSYKFLSRPRCPCQIFPVKNSLYSQAVFLLLEPPPLKIGAKKVPDDVVSEGEDPRNRPSSHIPVGFHYFGAIAPL
jgi:hypothetical protein